MKFGKFLTIILLSFIFSNTSSATIVTDYYDDTGQTFMLSWGGNDRVIDPLYKQKGAGYYDAAEYYGFHGPDGWSANTPDDLEKSDTALFFLFFDDEILSLFTILDIPNDNTGGIASITYSGLPNGSAWTVRDNPGDDGYVVDAVTGTSTVNWRWSSCCTDGGVIGNLGYGINWDIFIKPNSMQGITKYKFLTFKDGQAISSIQMSAAAAFNGFHIKSIPAPIVKSVPEPMALSLMVFGLLGFAVTRKIRSNKSTN